MIFMVLVFFADKVALSIGLSVDSRQRMIAAIKHVLAASREQGHCYLTEKQINSGVIELIDINLSDRLIDYLELMQHEGQLCIRQILTDKDEFRCYYSKTLFYDESTVGSILRGINTAISSEPDRIAKWISTYCESKSITLSDE
jgi:exodeoxyribonuclease V alpha subunit